MSKTLPRGIRNHNPGNIEKGDPWQGLAADQSVDERFAVFASAEWGIRALARVLITYQDKHGLETPYEIASRWAPAFENDVRAYASHLAERLGVTPHDPINVHDYAVMRPLVEAIIQHENGMQPYGAVTINEGLRLAGVRAPAVAERRALEEARPLGKTRTVKGGRVAAGAGGVALVSGAIAEIAPALPVVRQVAELVREHGTVMLVVLGALALAGAAWVIYARWDDRQRGVR